MWKLRNIVPLIIDYAFMRMYTLNNVKKFRKNEEILEEDFVRKGY